MKTKTFLSFCLFFSYNLLFAQNLDFSRTYGGERYDDIRSIVGTDDGGFVYTGLNKSTGDTLGDMYLTKINAAGAVLWENFYGLPEEDGGNFLMKTRDEGFLISGHTAYNYGTGCNGYIVKTDSEGEKLWRNFVGTAFDDVCNGGVQTSDGSYYFTGRVEDRDTRKFDVMLCKIREDGEYIFLTTFGGEQDDIGYKIVESSDGNLIIAGYSIHEDTKKESFYIIKCDKQGNLIWEYRHQSFDFNTRAYGLVNLEDGTYVISGGIAKYRALNEIETVFIANLDQEGELLVFKSLPAGDLKSYGFDLCVDKESRFGITGMALDGENILSQPIAFVVDNNYEVVDYKLVAEAGQSRAVSIVECGNNEFLIAGKSKTETENTDMLISRLSFSPSSVNNAELKPYSLFPNPMSDYTYLKLDDAPDEKTLNLFNVKGELVSTNYFKGPELILQKGILINGLYFFQVNGKNGKLISSGKLMVK